MATRNPSPPEASSPTSTLVEQNVKSSKRQPLTTSPPKQNFSHGIGDRRKHCVPTAEKNPKTSQKVPEKLSHAYKKQSDDDAVLRQAFDFGSLQNLQDGSSHHRPINLRDLEKLESDKFIMPRQEFSNQTRKRSARPAKDELVEGGKSTANEQGNPKIPRSANQGVPPKELDCVSSGDFFSHSRSITEILEQPEVQREIIQENDNPTTGYRETTRLDFWNTVIRCSIPLLVSFAYLVAASSLNAASICLISVLEKFTRSSNIPRGMVRIRWTCKCGKQLYDDFIEKLPGAARTLELHLNRPRERFGGGVQRVGGAGSESSSASISSSFSASSGLSNGTQATSFTSGDLSGRENLMSYIPATETFRPEVATDTGPLHEQLWLLTCAERHKFTTKLIHLDMNPYKVSSDRDLALLVKEQYLELRPAWRRFLRLRGLHTIQFVQFEAHRNHVVDIRKCPDLPAGSNINYKFSPSDVIPPVGENYLMHLFYHPEDYEDELITYKRIPKKRGMKLRVLNKADVGIGWGVHLVEGFLAYKIWTLITMVFALGSLVFAIVWTVQKGDVQGAFGVAAYVCTLSTLAIGCGLAYLE